MEVYKIVRDLNGFYKTLFHGVNRSRILQTGKWLKAEKRMSCDGSGGRPYLTGFHVFKDAGKAEAYCYRFSNTQHITVIRCLARGLRQKPTNKDVFLADEIFIP